MHSTNLLLEEPVRMASILEPSKASFFPAMTKSRSVNTFSSCLKAGMPVSYYHRLNLFHNTTASTGICLKPSRCGYGQSSGKPSEQNTYAGIEAAYKCLIENFGSKEEEITLYGQSAGSGPTVDLFSRLPR